MTRRSPIQTHSLQEPGDEALGHLEIELLMEHKSVCCGLTSFSSSSDDTAAGRGCHLFKIQGSFCLSDLPSLECSLVLTGVVSSPSLCIPGQKRKRESTRRKGATSVRKTQLPLNPQKSSASHW